MRQQRKWVHLLLLLGSLLPGVAYAYEGDHYTLTYYLALQMGYTRRQAFQIASAAYAIDWDKDTGPMEAKAGDAIFGANHAGLTGTAHPQIANIWRNFHAFADEALGGDANKIELARQRQKDVLWTLAVAQRNPGPLIHFTQDYFSHFEYDNVRGHAKAGHVPDFISTNKDKARDMMKATAEVLRRFMREVLGGQPKEPNWSRVWDAIDRVAVEDPPPYGANPTNFNPYGGSGSPSLSGSLKAVRAVIAEDEAAHRLAVLPEDWDQVVLPQKWYQYEYDATGHVTDPNYAVETPKVELLKAEFTTKPIDDNNFTFALKLTYRLSDFKALKAGDGTSFLTPLPVYERHLLSDTPTLPRVFKVERGNGEFSSELEVQRSRTELEKGVTWTPTIFASGFDSLFKTVTLPVPPESKIAQDCKDLAARALKLLQAGDVVKAAELMEEARQKNCDGLGASVDAALQPVKKELEEKTDKLAEDGKDAVKRCEYEEALEMARMLQKIDPQSPWLLDLPSIEPQAEGQKNARVFVKEGQDAILKKDLDGAIAGLEKAKAVAAVPQCMLDMIEKLLVELRAHKDFIKKTADVEAATTRCDYKEAARLIGEIQALSPRQQYVADWLAKAEPVLKDLQDRERRAIQFIRQAEASAGQANTGSQTDPVDWTSVQAKLDAAFKALTDADAVAPACLAERKEMEAVRKLLLDIGARKTVTVATSVVLLIDASGSMGDNNKIFQAKVAAKKAAANASKTTEIAVLSFDGGCDAGSVRIVNGFSTDPNAAMKAIDGIQPGGGTPMYIATGVAVDYAQRYGKGKARAVVLMSDGGDSCRDKQAQAAASIRSSNIPVSTIGFDVGNNQQAQDDMRNLSGMTGGRSFSASAADPREIIRAFNMALLPNLLKDLDFKAGGGASGGAAVQQYYLKAKSLVQQQDLGGAIFQFQQANKLVPGSANTNFNLALLYEADDQLIPALTHANNYLKLAPMAADRGDVETRVANLQEELRRNPRSQLDPASCREVYAWAQGQQEAARKSGKVTRRQAIIELLIAAQKGDCDNARKLQASYREKYL